jgi:hypothetical protein
VLPGPCQLINWAKLVGDRSNATDVYLDFLRVSIEDEMTKMNVRLAEDRVLSLALVLRSRNGRTQWVSGATFFYDPEYDLFVLLEQRRRWINGTWNTFYYLCFSEHGQRMIMEGALRYGRLLKALWILQVRLIGHHEAAQGFPPSASPLRTCRLAARAVSHIILFDLVPHRSHSQLTIPLRFRQLYVHVVATLSASIFAGALTESLVYASDNKHAMLRRLGIGEACRSPTDKCRLSPTNADPSAPRFVSRLERRAGGAALLVGALLWSARAAGHAPHPPPRRVDVHRALQAGVAAEAGA